MKTMIEKETDLLVASKINAIEYPSAELLCGSIYDLEFVCVETGLSAIDVCGIRQNIHFSEFICIYDGDGNKYDIDDFYNDR